MIGPDAGREQYPPGRSGSAGASHEAAKEASRGLRTALLACATDRRSLANTYVNAACVLSQLERHEEALARAQAAVRLLESVIREVYGGGGGGGGGLQEGESALELGALLVFALHNEGVELEHLRRFRDSEWVFAKAVRASAASLPPGHPAGEAVAAGLAHVRAAASDEEHRVANRRGRGGVPSHRVEGEKARRRRTGTSPRARTVSPRTPRVGRGGGMGQLPGRAAGRDPRKAGQRKGGRDGIAAGGARGRAGGRPGALRAGALTDDSSDRADPGNTTRAEDVQVGKTKESREHVEEGKERERPKEVVFALETGSGGGGGIINEDRENEAKHQEPKEGVTTANKDEDADESNRRGIQEAGASTAPRRHAPPSRPTPPVRVDAKLDA